MSNEQNIPDEGDAGRTGEDTTKIFSNFER